MSAGDRPKKLSRKPFKFSHKVSSTPLTVDELREVENALAALVAQAYKAEHPEKFKGQNDVEQDGGANED
jgi:hypothetical protein